MHSPSKAQADLNFSFLSLIIWFINKSQKHTIFKQKWKVKNLKFATICIALANENNCKVYKKLISHQINLFYCFMQQLTFFFEFWTKLPKTDPSFLLSKFKNVNNLLLFSHQTSKFSDWQLQFDEIFQGYKNQTCIVYAAKNFFEFFTLD